MTQANNDKIAKARESWDNENQLEKNNLTDISKKLQLQRQHAFLSGIGKWVIDDANTSLDHAYEVLESQHRSKTLEPPGAAVLPQKESAPRGWLGFFGVKQQKPAEDAPKVTSGPKQTPGQKR